MVQGDTPWILYVDADEAASEQVQTAFGETDIRTEVVTTIETASAVLADSRPSCIVSEYDLPDGTGLSLLESVQETNESLPVVLFTDSGSEQVASEAVTAGVSEYLRKRPLDEQLPTLVQRVTALLESTRDDRVSERLKDRAMDRAPVGITIADMRLQDEPLVYVNEAFERLTGYSVAEAIGRNCRFLQGDATDEAPVTRLREAIENDEATAVELQNYRKDGTEFWNRVEIAPIRSVDGETTHYVGYQTDVSVRKEAEIKARERAQALERKQQELEAVLTRIEGLLRDVSVGVMQTRTADDIAQEACDALGQADGYRFVWMGERAHDGDSVELQYQTTAGVEIDTTSNLVETAIREGVVAFDGKQPDRPAEGPHLPTVERELSLTVETASTWLGTAEESRRAVVPVTYRETTYGVIGIHTDDGHAFDRHDAVVLSTVGRIVGTALNAVRTQSLLQGEAVIELELSLGDQESFVGLTSDVQGQLVHVGTVPPGENPELKLFFEVADGSPTAVVEAAADRADIEAAAVVREADDGNSGLVRLSIVESPLLNLLIEYGGMITDARAADGAGSVTVQLSKDANPRTFVEEVESRIPGTTLSAYHDDERPQRTNQEFVAEVNTALTDRQRDALQTAYAIGFFDWPRKASGDDVAEMMDISRPTFHQHLRTAERKLLDAFYNN